MKGVGCGGEYGGVGDSEALWGLILDGLKDRNNVIKQTDLLESLSQCS